MNLKEDVEIQKKNKEKCEGISLYSSVIFEQTPYKLYYYIRGGIMIKTFKKFTFGHGAVLRNRLVLAPMTTYASNEDLTLSKEEEVYYKTRSKGMGMVITAATAINKNAQAFENQITARDERYLDSMKRLSNAIKSEGALSILQLHHGGRMNIPGLYTNQDIVCPSCVKANRDYAVEPRELKTSEVYDIIDAFVKSEKIAIKDGLERTSVG